MIQREKINTFVNLLGKRADYLFIREKYPHIAIKFELICGDILLGDFIKNIMTDTRDGKREGFPKPVAIAISSLREFHDDFFKEELSKQESLKPESKQINWWN